MKRQIAGIFCVLLLSFGFARAAEHAPVSGIESRQGFFDEFAGGDEGFFPPAAFSVDSNAKPFAEQWYSKQLSAMGEPSVFQLARTGTDSIYRFTWLRAFHAPVAVRLTVLADGSGELHAVVLRGQGGYEPGKVKRRVHRQIQANDVRAFLEKFDLVEFWHRSIGEGQAGCWHWIPERDSWMRLPEMGLDGAQWILEAAVSNRYNIVERWSPESGALREAALELIRLSGLRIKPIY